MWNSEMRNKASTNYLDNELECFFKLVEENYSRLFDRSTDKLARETAWCKVRDQCVAAGFSRFEGKTVNALSNDLFGKKRNAMMKRSDYALLKNNGTAENTTILKEWEKILLRLCEVEEEANTNCNVGDEQQLSVGGSGGNNNTISGKQNDIIPPTAAGNRVFVQSPSRHRSTSNTTTAAGVKRVAAKFVDDEDEEMVALRKRKLKAECEVLEAQARRHDAETRRCELFTFNTASLLNIPYEVTLFDYKTMNKAMKRYNEVPTGIMHHFDMGGGGRLIGEDGLDTSREQEYGGEDDDLFVNVTD